MINRWDVMHAPFKLFSALALAAAPLCGAPASAQPATDGKGPAKVGASKPTPPKPAGAKPSEAKPKTSATTAARTDAEPAATPAVKPTPVPRPPQEEVQHTARYDKAIAATRNLPVSAEDAGRIRDAVKAIAEADLAKAKALRDQITLAAGRKLIDWYLYRGGYGTAAEIRAFMQANPAWPDRERLTQRTEEALFNSNSSPREIKAFFSDAPPATGIGLAALATALAADKDEVAAKTLAAKAWVEHAIPAAQEASFLKKVGALLTESDHKRRLDRLLLNDSRWTGERNERAAVIRRVIALLSEPEKKKAQARLAVFLRAKNSEQLMAKLPPQALSTEWGLAVQRAQALRRQKKHEAAWQILLTEPDATLGVKPDGWWEERRASAYAALKAGKAKTAYDLVRDPGPLSVNAQNGASFMAGWLALRHLHEAKKALVHFEAFTKSADGPLSRARAHYWLGRCHETLGDQAKARESYRTAAAHIDTFHGQLARLKLDPQASALPITPPATPTPEEIAGFNGLDAVQAIVLADKAGLDPSLRRAFLNHLRFYFKTEAEAAMLAHLAEALGDTQMAVRIGKTAVGRGLNLIYYAYPVHRLPAYTPLRRPAETAFILGIARQESEFNVSTLSGAGARGILQVMPITARHICRDYKLKCDIPRLMTDAAYNTMMGSAYIADRMDEFTGSYVLTLAGYNAGPGRAREWIKEFGDPRSASIDPIDWIHRIPIEETREYVQKVLSNIQIYRARLGETNAVRLNADLKRASIAPSINASVEN
ncbi:MAG: transglycosylase SLT domain-containing protein [Hyphomonadaceae bacterium]|nr:transglycosylase SLT domain-containing protein [Hyphomonadaceae bacterium]